jgi:tetratricopeptide (TPR) repeat protein
MKSDNLGLPKERHANSMQELEVPDNRNQVAEVTFNDETMISEINDILRIGIPANDGSAMGTAAPESQVSNDVRFDMGVQFLDQGYYYQARDIFLEFTRQGFREYESLVKLGIAQRKLGDVGDAAMSLNKALVLRTDAADAWHQLALLMMESERPLLIEARAFLRQAFRLSPNDYDVSATLQRCEMMLKGYTA